MTLKSAVKRITRRILASELDGLGRRLEIAEQRLDGLRQRVDLDPGCVDAYLQAKTSPEYAAAYQAPNPLVSVCVATYNRAQLLTERCLSSLLSQTYQNLEVIVVGDACTDDTEEKIQSLRDPRVHFENLEARGTLPEDSGGVGSLRWMVAGSAPMNRALDLARGQFITHLDDDDVHSPDRVEKLLESARATRADVIFHPFFYESGPGSWLKNEAQTFELGRVTTSSVFYHSWFRRIPWDTKAYQYREPGDWNRLMKFQWLGAQIVRHPDYLLWHHREGNNAR